MLRAFVISGDVRDIDVPLPVRMLYCIGFGIDLLVLMGDPIVRFELDNVAKLAKVFSHCGKSNTFASQSSQPSSPRAGFARDFRSISALDVEGLGSVRNRLGDAHGQGKKAVRPAPRHAELAVNLAGVMVIFLVRTWEFHKDRDAG
jgi:hypothetical protein